MAGQRQPGPEESGEEPPPGPLAASQGLTSKHRATLSAIFERPTRSNITWRSFEALIRAMGGDIHPGAGSRRHVTLPGIRATLHEPHPGSEIKKGGVEDIREFLRRAGIRP